MSGSDNYNQYSVSSGSNNDCDSLDLEVRLSSVQVEALKVLKLGEELLIHYEDGSIIAKTIEGLTVGSLASGEVAFILECIKKGKKFAGIIIEIREGLCRINLNIKN